MRQSPIQIVVFALIAVCYDTACGPRPLSAEQSHGDAAKWLKARYATSRLAHWSVQVGTAGPGCSILYLRLPMPTDDATIESMHYSSGAYDIYPGGVNRFYRERAFTGVVYIDQSQRMWTYGEVTREAFIRMKPCD